MTDCHRWKHRVREGAGILIPRRRGLIRCNGADRLMSSPFPSPIMQSSPKYAERHFISLNLYKPRIERCDLLKADNAINSQFRMREPIDRVCDQTPAIHSSFTLALNMQLTGWLWGINLSRTESTSGGAISSCRHSSSEQMQYLARSIDGLSSSRK